MVAIHALAVLKWKDIPPTAKQPLILASYYVNAAWYTWFYKDNITEFLQFFCKLLAERTKPGFRQQITEKDFVGYVHSRTKGLTVVLITDREYNQRVAFNVVKHVIDIFEEFVEKEPNDFQNITKDSQLPSKYRNVLKEVAEKYQDPTKTDKILKIKQDLEETKTILNTALDKLLERGEKLDDLVQQAEGLSDESKAFYMKSRNSKCPCTIL